MEINCLSCGHRIDIGDAYDDYEGQVKCWVCGVLLEIKTEEGRIKAMRAINDARSSAGKALEGAC